PALVSVRFSLCVEGNCAVTRLQKVARAEQVQDRLIVNGKSLHNGIAKDSFARADGTVLVHDELQEFLVAAEIEGVVAEYRFDLDVGKHRQGGSEGSARRLADQTAVKDPPMLIGGELFHLGQFAHAGRRSIQI